MSRAGKRVRGMGTGLLVSCALLLSAGRVPAQEEADATPSLERLELASGQRSLIPPDRDALRLQLRGTYQARFTTLSELPLRPPTGLDVPDSLGQTTRLYHWHRFTPVMFVRDQVQLIAQADVPRGLVAGSPTELVDAADEPLDDRQPARFDLRWLFARWHARHVEVWAGMQPSHFGLGVLEHDGQHRRLFGDPLAGNQAQRMQLVLRSPDVPWLRARLAGDVVYRDRWARLVDGDVALRAVLSTEWVGEQDNRVGVYAAFRHQRREDTTLPESTFFEDLSWLALASTARLRAPLPGLSGYVFGEFEAAARIGRTTLLRTTEQTRTEGHERILAHGGALRTGVLLTRHRGPHEWAPLVAAVEWGWASGDADSYDGTYRRFDFASDYNVGLVLFHEVLAWKTARAATLATDPTLVSRPPPGAALLPSNGAVFGASYVYPTVLWRPLPEVDLKLALLVAQTTTDLVDPTLVETEGLYLNYDRGRPDRHDLGLELDGGTEVRIPLEHGMTLALGAQGGVLFAGGALADARGRRLPPQGLAQARLGFLY